MTTAGDGLFDALDPRDEPALRVIGSTDAVAGAAGAAGFELVPVGVEQSGDGAGPEHASRG
jgi:hypothetical protein